MKARDKVIWLTGASSGIGEALAYALSAAGAKLILSARRKEELERVKSACTHPDYIHVLPLDLAQKSSLPLVSEAALHFFGHIDILINNGGISQRALAAETVMAVDRKIMEVNYFGTVGLTKCLLPHFIQNKAGHIVVVSSLVGKFSTPYRSGYAASKHALHGFFDALRAELFADNIGVTMVCPGFIRTNVSLNALTGDGQKLNKMDDAQDKGMSPDVCASRIIKAIENNREEVYIGGKEKYAVYLKRIFPTLFSQYVRRMKVR